MLLQSLHIISFGGIRDREIVLSDGVNVLEGPNESGKSSAAMFIKFIFYGLSAKATKATGPSERARFISRETGQAAGYILAQTDDGTPYRLERAIFTSDHAPARERVRIINQQTGEAVTGQNPGEFFFGIPADIFVNTCFIAQASDTRPDFAGMGSSKTGSALDNLLTGADETVDVHRAVNRLDQTRRELLHKNQNGGEISELKEKRAELAAACEQATGKAAEILTVSTSLDDIKKRIAELEEADEHARGLFAALNALLLKRRLEASGQTRLRKEKVQASLTALEQSPFSGAWEETLSDAERDLHSYEEAQAAWEDQPEPDASAADFPGTDLPDPAEAVEEIHHLDSVLRMQFAAAAALLVAGCVGLAAAFLLYYFNTDLYVLPMFMTVFVLLIGGVFFFRYMRSRKKLRQSLEEWNAESVLEIETAVQEKMAVLDRFRRQTREQEQQAAALEAARLRADTAEQQIRSLAETAGLSPEDDLASLLPALRRLTDGVRTEKQQMQEQLVHLTGRLEAMQEQLHTDYPDGLDLVRAETDAEQILQTPIGQEAAALSSEQIKAAAKERDFTENALRAALKRQSVLEEKLAALGKLSHSPDELQTMLTSLDDRMQELMLRHDALTLAENAIRQAGEALRSGVLPRLTAKASALLAGCTPYDRLVLDADWRAGVAAGDDVRSFEHLSRGTADLTYIALRIALSEEIFREESPFLLFDESFAHVDADRMQRLFSRMRRQALVFTCRNEEAEAAEELGFPVIHLGHPGNPG